MLIASLKGPFLETPNNYQVWPEQIRRLKLLFTFSPFRSDIVCKKYKSLVSTRYRGLLAGFCKVNW